METGRITACLLIIFAANVKGIWCINATLQAVPAVVKKGEHTVLQCHYELQGALLYTAKWYKGQSEFYRFTPKENPKIKTFFVVGINVDLSFSNDTQVMLRKLDFESSGNFSCEVTADDPPFSTALARNRIDVVSLPISGPVIYTQKSQYESGDLLTVTCKSYPSKPATNLTILINNQFLSWAKKTVYESGNELEWSETVVSVPLTSSDFKNGRMVLRCMAQLHPLYSESATSIFVSTVDPKPERITYPSSSESVVASLKLVLISLFFLLIARIFEYEDSFLDYDIFAAEVPKNVKDKLIG